MNYKLIILTSLLTATGLCAEVAPPLVSTKGSAQVLVVPDLADLIFIVEVRNADLQLARQQQATRASKVVAALRAAGIDEKELKTSQVTIDPNYTDRREETEKLRFYSVVQSITCTLHDVKKVPDVTASAIAAGATGVRDSMLRSSEFRKHRDAARLDAVRAAKEKAIALAEALGAKVGRPYSISEDAPNLYGGANIISNNRVSAADHDDDAGGGSFAAGTIKISAEVSVSFLLE